MLRELARLAAETVGSRDGVIGRLIEEGRLRYLRRDGSWFDTAVSDHGIGIAEEDLSHLFERFQRGRNVDDRRFNGLGLGLYICHRIVSEHGGTIDVKSEPGAGTTFRSSLPLASTGVA